MLAEGGRRTRNRRKAAAVVTAPPLPPLVPHPAGVPLLPLDPAAPLRHPPPPLPPHLTAAAGVAAETVASARGGHQTEAGTGRREKRGVTTRGEEVAEERGTRRDRRRGGARKAGAGRPGAIGSIKIETGRTRDANVGLIQLL